MPDKADPTPQLEDAPHQTTGLHLVDRSPDPCRSAKSGNLAHLTPTAERPIPLTQGNGTRAGWGRTKHPEKMLLTRYQTWGSF